MEHNQVVHTNTLNPLFESVKDIEDNQSFNEENTLDHKLEYSNHQYINIETSNDEDEHNNVKDHDSDINHDNVEHEILIAPTKVPEWIVDYFCQIFSIRKRNTTIEMEIYTGIIQFISCLYVLPVVPFQMARCNYTQEPTIIATAVTCAIGCFLGGVLTDMPLIIAPPTSVSIFFAVSMQQINFSYIEGNAALLISGAMLAFIGVFPPFGRFLTMLIPDSIQAAISIGIGMITALAGATEINLVIHGQYTILDMGPLTPEIVIAISCLVLIAVLLHYHVKGSFCCGLFCGTFLWWCVEGNWPQSIVGVPITAAFTGKTSEQSLLLIFNLFLLYVLALNGMGRSLSDLAQLTKKNGSIPRGHLLYIVCGLTTMLSGYLSGPPILISPESAAGIKAGAKTGLSTVVCGVCFGISVFFSPILAAIPAAGTAPLLIMVGVMMFANCKRIDWTDYKTATSAYCTLFFIPFTYSILRGVAFGYVVYIAIGLFTGDLKENFAYILQQYDILKNIPLTHAITAKRLSKSEEQLQNIIAENHNTTINNDLQTSIQPLPLPGIRRRLSITDILDSFELPSNEIKKVDNFY